MQNMSNLDVDFFNFLYILKHHFRIMSKGPVLSGPGRPSSPPRVCPSAPAGKRTGGDHTFLLQVFMYVFIFYNKEGKEGYQLDES